MGDRKGTKVYVGNLNPDVNERDLREQFDRFGGLTDVWVARKPPGTLAVVLRATEGERGCGPTLWRASYVHTVRFSCRDCLGSPKSERPRSDLSGC